MQMLNRLKTDFPYYLQIMRVEKPVGWILLMCPTLWALWIAGNGQPDSKFVWIFAIGVIVMRSAGCVINDLADRKFDAQVERTKQRPLAAGYLQPKQAICLFLLLGIVALVLLFMLPSRVWWWAVPAVAVTAAYPFMKRFIEMPQMVLGIAFSVSIPMVYVALDHAFDTSFLLLLVANFCWIMAYDTAYAMSDRQDDLKIGIKSTAIYFGKNDKLIIGLLQSIVIVCFILLKQSLLLSNTLYLSIVIVIGLFVYQQFLIKNNDRANCFKAFLNNAWVGIILWFGLVS